MISDILHSFCNVLVTLGYSVRYSIGDKGNSVKLPLAEIDIKETTIAVWQTEANINKISFDVILYHPQAKVDNDTLVSYVDLEQFESIKRNLNLALRSWLISNQYSLAGFYGVDWSFQAQGINKEFAQNKPVKMFVVNCSLQYTE